MLFYKTLMYELYLSAFISNKNEFSLFYLYHKQFKFHSMKVILNLTNKSFMFNNSVIVNFESF